MAMGEVEGAIRAETVTVTETETVTKRTRQWQNKKGVAGVLFIIADFNQVQGSQWIWALGNLRFRAIYGFRVICFYMV